MRLFSYLQYGQPRAAISVSGQAFDAELLLHSQGLAPTTSVRELLTRFGSSLAELAGIAGRSGAEVARIDPVKKEQLTSPILDPEKVFCVGLNYLDHVGETGRALPKYPDVFTKFASSLTGPYSDIEGTQASEQLDFEGELAIVIGRAGRDIAPDQALSHVAGFTVMNDVTARDLQHRGTQWVLGKSLEGSTPLGPEIVTLDELPEDLVLDIETKLNGEQMQRSNTGHFIFPIADVISYISKVVTLSPGDIIATGTPAGIGAKRTPAIWMRTGDVIEVTIEGIGTISNRIA